MSNKISIPPSGHSPAPFGTLLGLAPGDVAAYSSDYDSANEAEYPDRHAYRSYLDGVYLGYKWQCVEFARRWLYLNRGYIFDDVAMAYEIFRLSHVREVASNRLLPLKAFANGSQRLPEPGCLLVWDEGGEFTRTGHVAIVTEVLSDRVRIAEQNVDHQPWPDGCSYSREIEARTTPDGHYWVRCSFRDATILGWVIQTDQDEYAETPKPVSSRLLSLQMRRLDGTSANGRPWLNEANPPEAAYVESMGGHLLSSRGEDQDRYLCISAAAEDNLKRATNELHALFMHATDYVLRHDDVLARFNIPSAIWPRIRQSWNNRRNQMITGRFDFAVTPNGIKMYEYNSDSASCHMECAILQGKWAHYVGCDSGRDPGERLYKRLVQAWRESDASGVVHILRDQDPEEVYHSLFMKEAMEAAGLECVVLDSLAGVRWADNGDILDTHGIPIRWVWKTWAWETALDQIRAECEADEERLRSYVVGQSRPQSPRLVDVLLRKNVMVYEPLWTLIPSNKAILPVLWSLFPHHPYLLHCDFAVNEALQRNGYVSKPIVGRCGANIVLVDSDKRVLEETQGIFEQRDQIYQELFPLPCIEGLYAQISTFSVAGTYAGSCVRTDYSQVIKSESDVLALRVLADGEF